LRFQEQCLAIDQLVGGALRKERQQNGSIRAQLGSLLLQHLSRGIANFLCRHVVATNLGDNPRPRLTRQLAAETAGNKSDHHGGANQQQQAAKHNLLDRSFSLQESNHLLDTPEVNAEFSIINYMALRS
jgi:hypothetical protein